MCGRGAVFYGTLQGKNGVKSKSYVFEKIRLLAKSGTYSAQMRAACTKFGDLKPVCEHPSYCRNDKLSLYLGQSGHLSHPGHRNNNNYSPKGLEDFRDRFAGLCNYANKAGSARGLCNIPINSHSWRTPKQADPGFICGKVFQDRFTGTMGGKNGVAPRTWIFEKMTLTSRSGKYADQMIAHCARSGMKPVCDHPSYCAKDSNAVYLGQAHHIGYPGHRNNKAWFPTGWDGIKDYFKGMCVYAAKVQGGGNALCNLPLNSHSWRATNFNPGFVCARASSFTATLGAKNGAFGRNYEFEIARLDSQNGKYSQLMVAGCSKIGMKPVCEHRAYCYKDKDSVFLGQTHHISYPPHRRNKAWFPSGWMDIQQKFAGLCYYSAKVQGGGNALCNRPINTHSWQGPNYNPGFPCARGELFTATLGAKNGVKGKDYAFEVVFLSARSGKYRDQMINHCKMVNMKPVCDHRNYCKNDKNSLYIGQTHHISYPPHRRNKSFFPSGWPAIEKKWINMCNYAATAQGGGNALCNRPINSHSWQGTGYNPGFICGRENFDRFTAKLRARKGIPARNYIFQITKLTGKSGKYADNMIKRCATYGMKPVCDHFNYCATDPKALYIGQEHHLGYPPHRREASWLPAGFEFIAYKWNGLCGYAAKVQGGGNALCNRPINTHSWQGTGYNPGFMCGRGGSFTARLGGKNGATARNYEFEVALLSTTNGK